MDFLHEGNQMRTQREADRLKLEGIKVVWPLFLHLQYLLSSDPTPCADGKARVTASSGGAPQIHG